MKILAIDTSTKYLSLAVADCDKILAGFNEREAMKHSSMLMLAIDGVLKKSNLKLKNIDAIALSIGPGSFTGLRIGVAACKGINLALGIPIIDVPTLDVIAYNFINEKENILCPLIDAKKEKVYSCFYEKGSDKLNRLSDYILTDISTLLGKINKPTVVFGDGVKLYGDYCRKNRFVRISEKDWFPKAGVVARLGFLKARKKEFADSDKLVPMYLHSKYCQIRM